MARSRYPMARRGGNVPGFFDNWGDLFSRFMPASLIEPSLVTGNIAPVDVCERDNEFVIRMACAGCRPEDVDVTVDEDMVRIRGKFMEHDMMGGQGGAGWQQGSQQGAATGTQGGAQATGTQTGGTQAGGTQAGGTQAGTMRGQREVCLIRELPAGRFERDIMLPTSVNAQGAQATFDNGLLTLVLPKAQAAQGHRIQIARGGQQGATQIGTGTGTPSGTGSR
jgi:HSP20 family molecular chaperone IbpA